MSSVVEGRLIEKAPLPVACGAPALHSDETCEAGKGGPRGWHPAVAIEIGFELRSVILLPSDGAALPIPSRWVIGNETVGQCLRIRAPLLGEARLA